MAKAATEVLAMKYSPPVAVGAREVYTVMNNHPGLRGFSQGAQNPDQLAETLGSFHLQPEGGQDGVIPSAAPAGRLREIHWLSHLLLLVKTHVPSCGGKAVPFDLCEKGWATLLPASPQDLLGSE